MHRSHGLQHLRHKRLTFASADKSGYTLGFRRRIAHSGLHAETGVFPPSATAQSCATSEITLYAVFVTPDSAALLYTYISRFSENPHHQQQFYLRPSFIPIFNFSHKRPTFAFTGESGYPLGFPRKIAHKGTHGETGGVSDGGWYHYPRSVPHVRKPPRAGCQNGKLCRFWVLVGRCSRRMQKACGTAMRLCASLFRGAAAPPRCSVCNLVMLLFFSLCAQGFPHMRKRGWYHYPRCALRAAETPDGRLSKRLTCRFLRSGSLH